MNNRYYANVLGADQKAILACLKKANEICAKDTDVNRIVLYSYTKNNFDTVARIFGPENVNIMFAQPLRFEGIVKPVQCLTERTYNDWSQQSCIVICCHMDSKAVQKVDDFRSAKYIMAVSWLKDELSGWVRRWNAECIYGEEETESKTRNDGFRLSQKLDVTVFGGRAAKRR